MESGLGNVVFERLRDKRIRRSQRFYVSDMPIQIQNVRPLAVTRRRNPEIRGVSRACPESPLPLGPAYLLNRIFFAVIGIDNQKFSGQISDIGNTSGFKRVFMI